MTKIKEYELSLEQMKIEQKRVDGEQKRKYMEEEAKIAKHKAEYQVKMPPVHSRTYNKGKLIC